MNNKYDFDNAIIQLSSAANTTKIIQRESDNDNMTEKKTPSLGEILSP